MGKISSMLVARLWGWGGLGGMGQMGLGFGGRGQQRLPSWACRNQSLGSCMKRQSLSNERL